MPVRVASGDQLRPIASGQTFGTSFHSHRSAGTSLQTVQATSPASFAAIGPGQAETVTWSVTPPDDANGGAGVVVSMAYTAPANASGSVSAEQWVDVQRPLPLPPGATDLALTASPSASYTSPWEHVTAINDGVYPTSSNDSQDIRWGCWPQTGTQWIELDWTQPITTNGSSVYFLDDGGGVRLPASWVLAPGSLDPVGRWSVPRISTLSAENSMLPPEVSASDAEEGRLPVSIWALIRGWCRASRAADSLKLPASVTGRASAGAARRVVTGRAAGTHGGRW